MTFFKRYFLLIIAVNHFYQQIQAVYGRVYEFEPLLWTIHCKIKQKYDVILKPFLEGGM
jgi:hypothetical protein